MSEAAASKVCVRCKVDVVGKPRVKDAKGRYLCRPCFDKAAPEGAKTTRPEPAAVGAGGAADPGDDVFDNAAIFDLAPTASAPQGGPCPGCGNFLRAGMQVCVNCGYNAATGEVLATAVGVEKVKARPAFKSKDDIRKEHLAESSRDAHRQAWINAGIVLAIGVVSSIGVIMGLSETPEADLKFYGVMLAIAVPASFLAFCAFALLGMAGGVGFFLMFFEIAALCSIVAPVYILTALIPLRIAKWIARGMILGGLSTWLLDLEEPYNYAFSFVLVVILIASAFGAAALLGV
ncbi:MAG: hypothetical protein R3B68_07125 [Phycisphaerales bacterium]